MAEKTKFVMQLYEFTVECSVESGFTRSTFASRLFDDSFYENFLDKRVGEEHKPGVSVIGYDKKDDVLTYKLHLLVQKVDQNDRTVRDNALLAVSDYLHRKLDENLISISKPTDNPIYTHPQPE